MRFLSDTKIKNDIYLGMGLVILALCLWLFLTLLPGKGDNYQVQITVDNKLFTTIDIYDEAHRFTKAEIEVPGYNGYNYVVIEDGYVYMSDADCPDKLCVHQGKISKNGQTIICLPHKVMIRITGGAAEYDGISK